MQTLDALRLEHDVVSNEWYVEAESIKRDENQMRNNQTLGEQ